MRSRNAATRGRRASRAALCLAAASLAAALTQATPAAAATYQVMGTGGLGLTARSAPSTGAPAVASYPEGASLNVVCQTNGTVVNGATWVWNRLSDGSYVSDYYVSTPQVDTFSVNLPNCPGTRSLLDPGVYPWPAAGPTTYTADGHGYFEGECTSFAAWAVRADGLQDTVSPDWLGNANSWHGARTESAPHVGDVAQWDGDHNGAGDGGHVAYVSEVYGDGTIQVEEYNWTSDANGNTPHRYNTRRISTSQPSRYLQF